MGRRSRNFEPPEKPKHRINRAIRFPQIRVIGADGDQLGVMHPDEARDLAAQAGLDLVEVAPLARPPVCKIMDYGKFKYLEAKKLAKNKSSTPEVKTVQMRPKTDDHDLDTKLKRAAKFLDRGDKVRFVMRLRGREQAYPDRWIAQLLDYVKSLGDGVRIATAPSRQGRMISMLVEPVPASAQTQSASSSPPARQAPSSE
ncbi:MAG: translation initiation factor IF-3 [Proteobacteria bacterium]|nr:MAG: translation initiation factor IF-3 [Pseudomonadota bacterium]